MIKMPLNLIYYYDEDKKLYIEAGTHRSISPKQYEKLEAERLREIGEDANIAIIGFVVLMAIIAASFIYFLTGGSVCH